MNQKRMVSTGRTAGILALLAAMFCAAGPAHAQLPASKYAPRAGQRAPDFALPDSEGKPVRISELHAGSPTVTGNSAEIRGYWVLLIFYRGERSTECQKELLSFQRELDKLTTQGVRVVAVSTDPPQVSKELRLKQGYSFTILSDTRAEVIREWNLLDAAGGRGGADTARPAEFLIDPAGTVRWVNLTSDEHVRMRPAAVLRVLDDFHRGASSSGQ